MPLATAEQYAAMLDAAASGGFAFAGVNVSSSLTLNAALRGFADAGADGIVQVSTGGGAFLSGASRNDMVAGARALAAFAEVVAENCPVLVALHTDHCPPDKLDDFLRPLLAESLARRQRGEQPLFHSQMFDGSTLPLEQNLELASVLLDQCARADVVLEIECGVVGGEEDGMRTDGLPERLYTTTEDLLRVVEVLGSGEHRRYLLAATFGNVHGVYQPGNVKLRPKVLADGQKALAAASPGARFRYVFHGGSGSDPAEIREAVSYGVVKMNIDSDTQYAFTRAVAGHMFVEYDGVLKIDAGVGRKQAYDPRAWGRGAEAAMAARVAQACEQLGSAGRSLLR
ncbi:MAG TPA: class II fructose-bisphosphate aldolase [Solirubrobacteraceae bacterium]|nr:class II fructose-bisphosphate aldolase [Solirubrobacteraceae bacterium]